MAARRNPPSFRAERGSGTIEQIGGRWWWQRSRTIANPDGSKTRKRWREGPFLTRDAAEAARRGASPVTDVYAERLTWDEWLERWLDGYLPRLIAGEQRSYVASLRRSVNLHLRPRLGAKVMADTTEQDIDRLWADLLSARDGNLARGTVENIRGALSLATKAAVARGIIPIDLVKAAPLPQVRYRDLEAEEERMMAIFSPEEIAWVVGSALAGVFGIWSGPMLIAADTGCRRGEALGIKWPDIDLANKTLWFRRQVLQESSQPEPALDKLKGRRSRRISLPDWTVQYLADLHEAQGRPARGLVFTDADGGLLHPDAWTQRWGRYLSGEFPQLAGRTIHDLRHSHASLLLRDGESVVVVSKRLGHATTSITLDTYSHALPDDSFRVAERWGRIVGDSLAVDNVQATPRGDRHTAMADVFDCNHFDAPEGGCDGKVVVLYRNLGLPPGAPSAEDNATCTNGHPFQYDPEKPDLPPHPV
jgi:integrase